MDLRLAHRSAFLGPEPVAEREPAADRPLASAQPASARGAVALGAERLGSANAAGAKIGAQGRALPGLVAPIKRGQSEQGGEREQQGAVPGPLGVAREPEGTPREDLGHRCHALLRGPSDSRLRMSRSGAAGNNRRLGSFGGRAIKGAGANEGDMRLVHGLAAAVLIAGTPAPRPGGGGTTIGESPARAQGSELGQQGFEAYLPRLRAEAERAGIRASTLDRIFPTLTFSARTVELDRAQPGGRAGVPTNPPFAPYRARQLTQALIERGRARYDENRARLAEIARRYGVPPQYLIAIWGKETGYGTIMGNFDLLNSLASLAYEGRRRALFTAEFIATLRMVERGFPREELVGSWAGAAGHPQFLPSVYLRLAVDGDGDGRPDIWRSHLDALASIGNYLRNAGWRPGLRWGEAVRGPAGLDRAAVASPLRAPRCAPR